MKILLFPRILAKTGVGNHVVQLAEGLMDAGHDVTIVSSTNDHALTPRAGRFVLLPSAGKKNPFAMLASLRALHRIIKENRIEIVHCHHRHTAMLMRLYRIFYRRVPVVYTLHASSVPHGFFHRLLSFGGDRNIGVSSEVSHFMRDKLGLKAESIRTVCNGVKDPLAEKGPVTKEEKQKICTRWGIPEGRIIIAMHSRIDAVKNHLLVVEALSLLPQSVRERVLVVCSGEKRGVYYQTLRQVISDRGLDGHFRFVGWVDTRDIFSIADCVVAPSAAEGFMLSACEAFMMQVPVFRSKTAGFADQKYCFPISNTDPQNIADAIAAFCRQGKEGYRERIDVAYSFAKQEFTLQAMTEKTIRVYEELV